MTDQYYTRDELAAALTLVDDLKRELWDGHGPVWRGGEVGEALGLPGDALTGLSRIQGEVIMRAVDDGGGERYDLAVTSFAEGMLLGIALAVVAGRKGEAGEGTKAGTEQAGAGERKGGGRRARRDDPAVGGGVRPGPMADVTPERVMEERRRLRGSP